ncbi:MAG: hypothetical protein RID15_14005 [Marinovum algicola]|uniref:hypothetical protein n=1 Tax=Marinovum algicola TaxID=42444 RepID=UPI0032ECCC34
MTNPFEREDSQREFEHCRAELSGTLAWCDNIKSTACMALELSGAGEIEKAMRVVQRMRSQLRFQADMLETLLGDFHFVATGSDEFDHENWLSATGEHDYMLGSGLIGDNAND